MKALLTFTSRPRRYAFWLLAVSVLPLLLTLDATPAKADYPSGYGFQWGPSRAYASMREPLNKSEVVSAIKMFVDEDKISEQLFGEPSLLLFVEDPQRPQEIRPGYGFREFEPEKSRMILDDEGIGSLSLTIAPDPPVPEAAEIAEAIAEQLRDNAGFEVTVIEGDADFLVSRAIGPSTPANPGDLSYDIACAPDTFRPNEWTVIDCVSQVHNNTDVDLFADTTIDSSTGVVPSYSYLFAIQNGERIPVSSQGLRFPTHEIVANQTSVTDLLILMKMTEGAFDAQLTVRVNEEPIAAANLHLTATKEAEDPPVDLEVTRRLVEKDFKLEDGPYADMPRDGFATYETIITNRSPTVISDLRVQNRYGGVASMEAEPATVEDDLANGFAAWDLSSFGKDSLQPGESLTLRTTYWPDAEDSCGQVETAAAVEATVDGETKRYAVPDDWQTVGHCFSGGCGAGCGSGDPTAFGSDGEGPTGASSNSLWATAFLAAAGAMSVVLATLVRRRAPR